MSSRLEGKLEPSAGSCCPGPSQGRRGGEENQLLHFEHGSGFLQTFQVPALSLQIFPRSPYANRLCAIRLKVRCLKALDDVTHSYPFMILSPQV